jgi:hypothetical protein
MVAPSTTRAWMPKSHHEEQARDEHFEYST